ncbi:MAG: cobyrinate a,c-diamide synthase / hydrogenobyrinic acid a,c-diamide synthase (glutamine-hydrolyzing) [Ilumatobacteraceae bacterium]|nr:cobyrinate a,c-diamide synthase / hydrogenobyrinic acid a,c-diamide synthase (glutamine-hydrolyzing) [Ilumatobacteraceae bacterium]
MTAARLPLPPRLVIAGTHSGVGKTTVATGLMAALRRAGHRVGAAKVGPDFIDPGYHSLAIGRPSRNLDMWLCGAEAIAPLAGRAGAGCDVLVVEGVMGLFDGAGDGSPSSTADVAVALDAPVVLVVDAAAMSQSVAALVHGFATHDPRLQLGGVILNRVGSSGHETLLRDALAASGVAVLGVLHRDDRLQWRDRHLGLIPVAEGSAAVAESIQLLAGLIADRCDLDAVVALARSAGTSTAPPVALPERGGSDPVRIAVAAGPAFSFTYPDNLEALAAAGAELVAFDPCTAAALPPACSGLLAGGGFPEVFAGQLGENVALLADVRSRVADGLVVWAECGGLLWLSEQLDGHPMAGVVPARARMTDRLTLGYRAATTTATSPLGAAGTTLRGHEFHYSVTEPRGTALELVGRHGAGTGGFAGERLIASYVHAHLGARPDLAAAFVRSCSALRVPYPN